MFFWLIYSNCSIIGSMGVSLSIVIPAQNEEDRISKTLSHYSSFFNSLNNPKNKLSIEIIVVVNNSSDKTSEIVDSYTKKFPYISKIETSYSCGKGGAVALGFAKATGLYIGFTDADESASPAEFYRLYTLLSETAQLDGVVGRRERLNDHYGPRRRVVSFLYNLYSKALFNLPYTDVQCGLKIFKKEIAKELGSKLSSTGWAFDVNILLLCKYLNYSIREFGVVWRERSSSSFSLYSAFFSVPRELLRLKKLEFRYYRIYESLRFLFGDTPQGPSKRKPRVLVFSWRDIKHPEMGGSEIYIQEVAKRLLPECKVIMFTSQPKNMSKTDIIDGIKIIRRGNTFSVYVWAFWYYVTGVFGGVDFVIDIENGIPFFTPLFSFKPKLLLFHHVHGTQWFKQFPFPVALVGYSLERFLVPLLYRHTPVVTVSPSTLADLKNLGFNDSAVFLGYNSIPKKVGPLVYKSLNPTLLYHGRIKSYKRIHIVLNCFKSILKEHPKARLVVSGDGDHLSALRLLAVKLKISDKISFPGFISEYKKWKLMQEAWVFLMPSSKEGWGITVIEAGSCGTPTVGFNVPGVRDSVKNNVTGLLVSDNDERAYLRSIEKLIEDTPLRKKLGSQAILWSGQFSWNTTSAIFKKIIDRELHFSTSWLLQDKLYPWEVDLRTKTDFTTK